jgi:hypothetical protein
MRRLAVVVLSLAVGCGAGSGQLASAGEERTTLQIRDLAGALLHSVDLPPGAATEPVLAGETVLVETDKGLTGIGLASGKVAWNLPGVGLPGAVINGLAVIEHDGGVEARAAATGEVVWRRETTGMLLQAWDGTGIALVVDPAVTPCVASVCPVRPPPTGVPEPEQGVVSLLAPATGQDLWAIPLAGRVLPGASAVTSRHVLVTVAPGNGQGSEQTVLAMDRTSGKVAWHVNGAIAKTTSRDGYPAVLADDDHAQVLDPDTGRPVWEVETHGRLRNTPFEDVDAGSVLLRDPRSGVVTTRDVPFSYGAGSFGDLLVGAGDATLTGRRGEAAGWTSDLPRGVRPVTFVDVDARYVVTVTSVGQPPARD